MGLLLMPEPPNYIISSDGTVHNEEVLPPLHKQAANLLKATYHHAKNRFVKVSSAEAKERYDKCLECEKFLSSGRCAVCGCFMEIKTTWAEQVCPIGKW